MVDVVIFSKNRPAQLDLLLTTLSPYDIFNVKVLYKYTENQYKLGYDYIKRLWNNISFEEEVDLKTQTLEHLKTYFCFFTDDSIIYRNINVENLLNTLPFLNEACFSLRLGLNTTDNHGYYSQPPIMKTSFGQEEDIIWWNPNQYYLHECFGYKLSLDGHIYHPNMIEGFHSLDFGIPNELEARMGAFNNKINKIYAFRQNVLVTNPINRVQEICLNWNGERYGRTTEELNKNLLKGKRLSFKPFFPNSTHYEVELD